MGAIMNSWTSTLLSAWAPPLRMFIIGTGSTCAEGPPTYRNSGRPAESAAARATARLTPRMALAPRRDLSGVPSRSISCWSTSRCSLASYPTSSGPMTSRTPSTALVTPLPPYRFPPSRSSTASQAPVEAPLGTAARVIVPSSRATSTSTVGFPRESRISRAPTASMLATDCSLASHRGPGGTPPDTDRDGVLRQAPQLGRWPAMTPPPTSPVPPRRHRRAVRQLLLGLVPVLVVALVLLVLVAVRLGDVRAPLAADTAIATAT